MKRDKIINGASAEALYNKSEDVYEAKQSPFDITVTATRYKSKPRKILSPRFNISKWKSPKGAGNMTVMPGDQEMIFFAPIAAGAGIAASPAITSTLGSTMSGINTVGNALAATTAGQRLTSGLNFITNTVRNSKAWPWIDTGLTSVFGAHGIDKVRRGDIHNVGDVVETGLDLMPLTLLWRPIISTAGKVGSTVKSVPSMFREGLDKLGFFVEKPGTYTRGIGITDAGLRDAVETGVFRGNPRGTERTAKQFTKGWEKNRDHFRDIMNDTGIKDIASKYQSRTLSEKEFNAIKEASKKYTMPRMKNNNGSFEVVEISADPLHDYPDYSSYEAAVNNTIDEVEKMPYRIASGEVSVNTELTPSIDGIPHEKPIEERFGPNSDYVGDGQPMSYWYDDGRNPITKGHSYAKSNYGVRVNNPDYYQPFMHNLHLHPSFFRTPRLSDPNIEVFKRGLFGITRRVSKEKLLQQMQIPKGLLPNSKPLIAKGVPEITAENASSITPAQWTAAQDAAIARGDMAEAQRLRDLHFKVSAPDTKVNTKVYHGNRTDDHIIAFDKSRIGSEHKDVGLGGFWFIDDPEIAKWEYALKPESWGKGIENAQFGEVIPAYINLKNPVQMEQLGLRMVESPYGNYPSADESLVDLFNRAKSKGTGKDGFIFRLKDSDGNAEPIYESIQNQFVVRNPTRIKSADAVTYDDNGVRIPLGERDNFKLNDIRKKVTTPGKISDITGKFSDITGKISSDIKNYRKFKSNTKKYFPSYLTKVPIDSSKKSSIKLLDKEFVPKFDTSVGETNKMYVDEILNRLSDMGIDINKPIPIYDKGQYKMVSPIEYARTTTSKPIHVGYHKSQNSPAGLYNPETDEAIIDLNQTYNDFLSSVLHERVIHPTDNIIDGLFNLGVYKPTLMYRDFLDKLFKKPLLEPDKNKILKQISPNYESSKDWWELRATIGEMKKRLLLKKFYDARNNGLNPTTYEDVRPLFIEEIDKMPNEMLGILLGVTNGYGSDYLNFRKNNPNFYDDLRNLLKYGAAYGAPVTVGAGLINNNK